MEKSALILTFTRTSLWGTDSEEQVTGFLQPPGFYYRSLFRVSDPPLADLEEQVQKVLCTGMAAARQGFRKVA